MTHFLLTPAARSLSIATVLRMTDAEAFGVFQRVRFADNAGEPFCPNCGCAKVYTLAETPIRGKCAACRRKFSVTSGTIFHGRKLAIRDYLAVIALFANGVKGTSALQMSRDMNINPKSAFVLLHKLREAMGATVHAGDELSGTVEVDGAYFGGHGRPENRKADRKDRRGIDDPRRLVVVVARERQGRAMPWVVNREADGVRLIRQHVASGTEVHADEAAGWNILHASYPMKRVNHSVEYKSEDGGCTNQAESFFSRIRRSEMGIHHRISGHRLQAYADECAWRENNRRRSNGEHWNLITTASLAHPKSATWAGYWHRKTAA
jgi:ISXO2-like transposase domain/Transposase zinc-ribbon domain